MSDELKLAGVHPTLIAKWQQVNAAMTALGLPMKVTDGCRTTGQQSILWARGRFGNAGPIVTNCDGLHIQSAHQVKSDGWGHAIDVAFVGDDPFLDKDPLRDQKWAAVGACAKAISLKWGGDFDKLIDKPHLEL